MEARKAGSWVNWLVELMVESMEKMTVGPMDFVMAVR